MQLLQADDLPSSRCLHRPAPDPSPQSAPFICGPSRTPPSSTLLDPLKLPRSSLSPRRFLGSHRRRPPRRGPGASRSSFEAVYGGPRKGSKRGGSGRVRMEEVHFVVVGPERAQTRSPLMAAVAIACHRICRPHHQELQAEDGTRLQISTILTRVLTGSTFDSTSFLDSPPPGRRRSSEGARCNV